MTKRLTAVCATVLGALGIALTLGIAQADMEESYGPITLDEEAPERPGAVVWMDLLTGDVPGSVRFYEQALGWSFELSPDQAYAWATRDGVPVAAISALEEAGAEGGIWLPSFSVTDIDGAVRNIALGRGQVIEMPEALPGRGRYLLAEDPFGAPFMLLRAVTGDPEPMESAGHWVWHELWTDDVSRVTGFYERILGYRTVEVKDEDGDAHHVMGRDGRPYASVIESPLDDVEPSWLAYILVDDIDAAVDRVRSAGGMVYVAPEPGTVTADMAIVGDPSGGVFGLQEREQEGNP